MKSRADGTLERAIMAELWRSGRPLQAAEVQALIDPKLAYTSVATVLTRLHTKGLVEREPTGTGRSYAYSPAISEAQFVATRMDEALSSASDRREVLARFVGGLSKRDAKAIRAMLEGDA
jgi:predicted transcriptional regulator